ncbi:MAG: Ku protein [Polyangiaceae bacterium]
MPARSVASATISFGLVSIPVKLFTATSSEQVRFNMLHPETKSRVKQQYLDASTGEVVDRNALVKGYEYGKDQYVIFTEEELKALEAERSSSLDIVEFVPLDSVDLLSVEKSYYLGPDKGGDKAYRLLRESMLRTAKVAVGRWAARGKEQLVVVRPYKDGLILHQMFYANEVRAFDEIDTGATIEFKPIEHELAERLIEQLSSDAFHPENYKDEYAARVEAAVQNKVLGEQVHVAQEAPKAQIIDLFEALKRSLSEAQSTPEAGASEPAKAARPAKAKDDAESPGEEVRPRPVKKAVPRKARSRKAG